MLATILIGTRGAMELPDRPSLVESREGTTGFSASLHSINTKSVCESNCGSDESRAHTLAGSLDDQGETPLPKLQEIVIQDGGVGPSQGTREASKAISNVGISPPHLTFNPEGQAVPTDVESSGDPSKPMTECPICCEYIQSEKPSASYFGKECDHKFHEKCIQPWLDQQREKATCPVCRLPVQWTKELAAKLSVPKLHFDEPFRKIIRMIRSLTGPQVAIVSAFAFFIVVVMTVSRYLPTR
ncbi:hypothetical protein PtB15_1B770 [Puccinia triticina]|nr:hypothetical protein PtB15_1B770 [Puccinia triticina]